MAKSITVSKVETDKNSIIFIEFEKHSSDGDLLGYHRTSISPGGDIDAQIAAVNNHMGSEGFAAIPAADVARVKATAAATWTPENIAPVTAQVVEAIAVQQAAITEAAAKKLEAEAAAAKEIEDAKARETAANEAKALAEAAEAAAKEAQAKAEQAKAASDAALKAAQDAADALAAQEKAAVEKAAFDKAVADAVSSEVSKMLSAVPMNPVEGNVPL